MNITFTHRPLSSSSSPRFAIAFAIVALALPHAARAITLSPGDIVVAYGQETGDTGLMLVDPVTGNRTIFSDGTHGTGPNFVGAFGVSLLPDGNLLVGDWAFGVTPIGNSPSRLIEVDRTTGDRTIISGTGVGSGPAFSRVIGGVVSGNSIIAPNQNSNLLMSVDLATGNRTILSGGGVGSGPAISYPGGLVLSGNTAILVNFNAHDILKVDLTTGDRSVFSGAGVGTGPAFSHPADIKFDQAGHLLVTDQGNATLFSLDPLTGDRTIVSGSTVGTGPKMTFPDPVGLAIESTGTIVVAISIKNAVYRIDPLTGDRTVLTDATHGTGPTMPLPITLVVIPAVPEPSTIVLAALGFLALLARPAARRVRKLRSRATALAAILFAASLAPLSAQGAGLSPGSIVVAAQIGPAADHDFGLLLVDPVTGNRTILSDNTHGTGTPFSQATGVTSASDGSLLVTDWGTLTIAPKLFRVDPLTGNRTIISGAGVGSGTDLKQPYGAKEISGQLILTDGGGSGSNGTIFSIDPLTGNRTIVSGSAVGTGPILSLPIGFVPYDGNVLVACYGSQAIMSVDLSTGNRAIVSGGGVGTGPTLNPEDLLLDGAGKLLTTSVGNSGLFSVDPLTGNRAVVSSNSVGTGPAVGVPLAISLEGSGTVLMTAASPAVLLRIDPATGNRTVLTDATHGTGPTMTVPQGVLVVPAPEPSTIVLAAFGLLLLAGVRAAKDR